MKPAEVLAAQTRETLGPWGNASRSAHAYAMRSMRHMVGAREAVAEFFDVPLGTGGVYFALNATGALNQAIKSCFAPGMHIITTAIEHNSVLRPLRQCERLGAEVDYVRLDTDTEDLVYDDFERLVTPRTKLLVTNTGSNVTGLVPDFDYIADFVKRHDLIWIADGSQTAGQLDISLAETGIDALIFTGHKSLYGPQGSGGGVVSERFLEFPRDTLYTHSGGTGSHSQSLDPPEEFPDIYEAGTQNMNGISGLAIGIRYLQERGMDKIQARTRELDRYMLDGLAAFGDKIKLYGAKAPRRVPVISISVPGWDSADLADALATDFNIASRSGLHCAPLVHQAYGTTATGLVRFSLSSITRKEDIDALVAALTELIG